MEDQRDHATTYALTDIARLPISSGIYAIINTVTDERYVGKAKNIRNRIRDHVRDLDAGRERTNEAMLLQKAWTAYGRDAFGVFTGRDFRAVIKAFQLEDIKIRLHHPQSNGVYDRFNGSTRQEGLRDVELRDLHDAREVLASWVETYNHRRLHSLSASYSD